MAIVILAGIAIAMVAMGLLAVAAFVLVSAADRRRGRRANRRPGYLHLVADQAANDTGVPHERRRNRRRTAVDITPDQAGPAAVPTNLPARRERTSEVIRPLAASELVQSFTEYQDLLPKLLQQADWQDAGRGQRFVKKSGWRKIATAFDLDVTIVSSTVERDLDGTPLRAEVIARAIAPSGRMMDGDGYCSVDEDRFSGPRGNKSKLENDLRATATTRAKNRAIADLVGMGAVSAEEVSATPTEALPAWARPANGDELRAAIGQVLEVTGVEEHRRNDVGSAIWQALADAAGGPRPQYAVPLLNAVAHALRDTTDTAGEASA